MRTTPFAPSVTACENGGSSSSRLTHVHMRLAEDAPMARCLLDTARDQRLVKTLQTEVTRLETASQSAERESRTVARYGHLEAIAARAKLHECKACAGTGVYEPAPGGAGVHASASIQTLKFPFCVDQESQTPPRFESPYRQSSPPPSPRRAAPTSPREEPPWTRAPRSSTRRATEVSGFLDATPGSSPAQFHTPPSSLRGATDDRAGPASPARAGAADEGLRERHLESQSISAERAALEAEVARLEAQLAASRAGLREETSRQEAARELRVPLTLCGVGVRLEDGEGAPRVAWLHGGFSAESSGAVRAGDLLVAVDRRRTVGVSADAVAAWLRGPRGTPVSLLLRRGGRVDGVRLRRGKWGPEHAVRWTARPCPGARRRPPGASSRWLSWGRRAASGGCGRRPRRRFRRARGSERPLPLKRATPSASTRKSAPRLPLEGRRHAPPAGALQTPGSSRTAAACRCEAPLATRRRGRHGPGLGFKAGVVEALCGTESVHPRGFGAGARARAAAADVPRRGPADSLNIH